MGYVTHKALQPPSDLRRVMHGLDSEHDLCGADNSATDEPRRVIVTVGQPSPLWRLWPFGGAPTAKNITVLRGARDHTKRPLLYFTFPTGSFGGVPSAAVCVSSCPQPPPTFNGTAASPDVDPAAWVCTGRYYGSGTDRCSTGSTVESVDARGSGNSSGITNARGGGASACETPPGSTLFSDAGAADELARCDDPLQECTVRAPLHSSTPARCTAHRHDPHD